MSKTILDIPAYPLAWPHGWARSKSRSNAPYKVEFAKAYKDLVAELRKLGAVDVAVSSNVRTSLGGVGSTQVADTGVAVYWSTRKGTEFVHRAIACDKWDSVKANLRACGLTIEAMRMIERAGASQVLDKMYLGLIALAADNKRRTWREVFDMPSDARPAREFLFGEYKRMASVRHPDKGGSHEEMAELNRARDEAVQELGL